MEHVLTKVRCGLSIVRKAKSYLNQESLLILYHTMIMSHILYCNTVWGHDNKTIVQKLQRSVNNFIRIIFDLNARDSVVGRGGHGTLLKYRRYRYSVLENQKYRR